MFAIDHRQTRTQSLLATGEPSIDVEGRFADPVFAADVSHSGAAFRLPHCPQDLLFRMSLVRHPRVLLVLAPEDHACRFTLNLSLARFSGFGSERSSGEAPRWIKFAALAAFVRV